MDRIPRVTVAAIVLNGNGEMLLLKSEKWRGKYGIPAGKVEYGERTAEAVKREIREETGLAVERLAFLKVQELINEKDFWEEAHFVSVNYVCSALPGNVKLNHEAQGYAWARPKQTLGMGINRPTRELVEHYLAQR